MTFPFPVSHQLNKLNTPALNLASISLFFALNVFLFIYLFIYVVSLAKPCPMAALLVPWSAPDRKERAILGKFYRMEVLFLLVYNSAFWISFQCPLYIYSFIYIYIYKGCWKDIQLFVIILFIFID